MERVRSTEKIVDTDFEVENRVVVMEIRPPKKP
jgi:hypothetical protein